MGRIFGGALIGFLLGLLWCYWKQINTVYSNRNLISSGANLASAASDFSAQLGQKL